MSLRKNEIVLRLIDVRKITGLSTSSIYARIADETFPESISLGGRSVGWLKSEIMDWIDEKIQERKKQRTN